jgi:hypothetical protein
MNLDAKVNNMTLRKYLMSRAPKTSVIQRLFVSADKSWRGNTFTLVTVKPYAAEAMKALNCMIPECLHHYGEDAAKIWFSNAGLLAYQNVTWDPNKQSTTSHQDSTTKALVEEDLFQIGSNWKMEAPILQTQTTRDDRQAQQPNYTVENLLASRNTDSDVRSFGSVFGRNHDSESIISEKTHEQEAEPPKTVIQIDPDILIEEKQGDDMSFDASSAGFTTGTTRAKLHNQTEINAELLKENQVLATMLNEQNDDNSAKTTKSTTEKLAEALEQIALMKQAQAHNTEDPGKIISPELHRTAPVDHEPPDTATDSVGQQN